MFDNRFVGLTRNKAGCRAHRTFKTIFSELWYHRGKTERSRLMTTVKTMRIRIVNPGAERLIGELAHFFANILPYFCSLTKAQRTRRNYRYC